MSEAPSNPYQTPNVTEELTGSGAPLMGSAIPAQSRALGRWQMVMSIVLFVFTGLVALYLLFMMVMMFGFVGGQGGPGEIGAMIGGLSCGLLMVGLFYLLPAVALLQAANTAKRFSSTTDRNHLADLVKAQLRFWRLTGALVIVGIGLVGIGLVAQFAFAL